jgi:predicted TIM-barrel fold metal-dependent hydrolase
VDAHVHFFDRDVDAADNWWPYLQTSEESLVRDVDAVQPRRFTPPEFFAEARRLGAVAKCVHIESAHGAQDPVLETEWLGELRSEYGVPTAAVVRVALDEEHAPRCLEAHLSHAFVRGVRDPGKTSLLANDAYVDRVRALGRAGLVFELYCTHRRFESLQTLVDACPDTLVVLEHFGLPPRPAEAEFALWTKGIKRLGRSGNVVVKLSGLGLMARDWELAEARAVVHECLDAFGADRCLFGSNFPIDKASNSYPDSVAAVASAMAGCSEEERRQVLATTAERVYRI